MPEVNASTGTRAIDMSFTPKLEQVSAVREFLEIYYQPLLQDPDLVCRMAVAVHELLENAAKYSGGGIARIRVEVKDDIVPAVLSVTVWNVVDHGFVEELKTTVRELTEADDAFGVYQQYLARAAKRKEGSGLGLARIRAEADMTLMLDLQGDSVCIEAAAALAPAVKS